MNVYHITKKIYIENYFWYLTADALILLFTRISFIGTIITPIILFYLAFKSRIKYQETSIKLLIISIWFSVFISWLLNSYDNQGIISLRFLWSDFAYMFGYYIGCSLKDEEYQKFIENLILPVSIVGIIGIYLFIFPPGWYMDRAQSQAVDGINISLEALRLRSIFPAPYALSYIISVVLTFIFFRIFQYDEPFKKYKYYIVILVIVVLLCMQRAPFGGIVIGFIGALVYGIVFKHKYVLFYKTVILSSIVLLGLYVFAIDKIESEMGSHFVNKIESLISDDSDFLESRYELMEAEESLFGDGAGRHSRIGEKYGNAFISDGQYKKITQEQGYVGEFLYITLFICVVIKCIRYVRYLAFELCIIIFLLFSMIGANPLSGSFLHAMLWWLIIGRISSFRPVRKGTKMIVGA